MPIWLDKRYANMISPRLEQFKWKKPNLANFRCPYCGDSQKNKRKARGYLYVQDGLMFYKCWNCPASTTFAKFLEYMAPELHMEYARESFAEKQHAAPFVVAAPAVPSSKKSVPFKDLKYCSRVMQLPEDHYARVYLRGRGIPAQHYVNLVFTENMNLFVKNFDEKQDVAAEPCIVVLIRDASGQIVGCNGRSLTPDSKFSKYIKAKVSEDVKLIYGIDCLLKERKIYVCEGEFNSMFIPNAVAVGGVVNMFGIENSLGVNKEQIIQIVDNDPRNPDVVKILETLIDAGYNVVILPGNIDSEDINDLVRDHKLSSSQLVKLLEENTYSGLFAKLRLTEWKKCIGRIDKHVQSK